MKQETILELIGLALNNKFENNNSDNNVPFELGQKYFIRTATYHCIGEVEKITGNFIEFKEGTFAWVADSGRFMQAINNGILDEAEPVSVKSGVNILSIIDYFVWKHKLITQQK